MLFYKPVAGVIFTLLLLGLLLYFCSQFSDSTTNQTPLPRSNTPPGQGESLPELQVGYSLYANPNACGVQGYIDQITIYNTGSGDAGTFQVQINDQQLFEIESLAAGASYSIMIEDARMSWSIQVEVDVTQRVPEWNEENNVSILSSATSTYLVSCTPTPTPFIVLT